MLGFFSSLHIALGGATGNFKKIYILMSLDGFAFYPDRVSISLTFFLSSANSLQHLVSLLNSVYWTTASEVDGAANGFTLTKGEFTREVQVEFATGEITFEV